MFNKIQYSPTLSTSQKIWHFTSLEIRLVFSQSRKCINYSYIKVFNLMFMTGSIRHKKIKSLNPLLGENCPVKCSVFWYYYNWNLINVIGTVKVYFQWPWSWTSCKSERENSSQIWRKWPRPHQWNIWRHFTFDHEHLEQLFRPTTRLLSFV